MFRLLRYFSITSLIAFVVVVARCRTILPPIGARRSDHANQEHQHVALTQFALANFGLARLRDRFGDILLLRASADGCAPTP